MQTEPICHIEVILQKNSFQIFLLAFKSGSYFMVISGRLAGLFVEVDKTGKQRKECRRVAS